MTATAHMPLIERLRKGANCVVFLDGAPEPAADVADMLRKAADEIDRLWVTLQDIAIGVGEKVLTQSEMRARALAALSHKE